MKRPVGSPGPTISPGRTTNARSAPSRTNCSQATFIGLGAKPVEVPAPLEEETPTEVLAGLHKLVSSYLEPTQGFTARRMVQTEQSVGDYDQLARFGEWDATASARPEDVE